MKTRKRAPLYGQAKFLFYSFKKINSKNSYLSLAIDEFLDIDFGDISKSLSDLYKKLSLLCGKFCSTRPADGDAAPSNGLLPGLAPFSTSKLQKTKTNTYEYKFNLQKIISLLIKSLT